MRITALVAMCGLAMILFAIVGCGGGTDRSVRGTITNPTGTVDGLSVVLLRQSDGAQVGGTITTGAGGSFSFDDIPNGIYVVKISGGAQGYATTYAGPFTVLDNIVTTPNIQVDTPAQLDVTVPTDNTATVVAFGTDNFGMLIPVTVAAGTFSNLTAASPVVLDGITPPGTYDVSVTNPVTSITYTFPPVTLAGNAVTVFRAYLSSAISGGGPFTFKGNVITNDGGVFPTSASVQLVQNGTDIGNPVGTGFSGAFTVKNINPGNNYFFRVTSTNTSFPVTLIGPFTINNNTSGNQLVISSLQKLGVTKPIDNTTTLVVSATDLDETVPPQLTVQVDTFTPIIGAQPIIKTGLPTGNFSLTVTDTAEPVETVAIPNVAFVGNQVLDVQIKFP